MKPSLLELAERCEQAGSLSPAAMDAELADIDRAIRALGLVKETRAMRRYTASLDAAMTLMPGGWWLGAVSQADPEMVNGQPYACVVANESEEVDRGYGEPPDYDRAVVEANAATPALALCAAALRASNKEQE
jgi:hypothetical protein